MSTLMGQWMIWGIIGLVGLFGLAGIITWLQNNKRNNIIDPYAHSDGTAINDGEIDMSASADVASVEYRKPGRDELLISQSAKSNSWGFFPWALISLLVLGALGWLVWTAGLDLASGSFKWILWSLLALAGLFSVLGIAQMTRRHPLIDEKRGSPRGLGFLTLISGLVLGLASWFIWQPKIAGFSGMQSGFEDRESKLKVENKGLASKLISRDTIIKRLTGDVEKSTSSYASLEKDFDDQRNSNESNVTRLNGIIASLKTNTAAVDTGNSDEITRLNGIISGLTKDKADINVENTRMHGLIGTYKNDNEVQSAKISALDAEMIELRKRPTATRSMAPAPVASVHEKTPLEMIHTHEDDDTLLGLTSGDYNIVKAAEQKMVQGKRGHFYFIDLKNPATGKAYKFASASYSSVKNQDQFKKSLDRAIANIKGAFDGKRGYQLYVRGKASAGRYSGKMADGYEYTSVNVLPRDADKTYRTELVERTYGKTIDNDDLPNMRGAYLQEYIGKNYDVAKPIILDGHVSKSKDAKKQALSVILFVED